LVLTFSYSDEDALRLLKNNKIDHVNIHPVDNLSSKRLEKVIKMLSDLNIKITHT